MLTFSSCTGSGVWSAMSLAMTHERSRRFWQLFDAEQNENSNTYSKESKFQENVAKRCCIKQMSFTSRGDSATQMLCLFAAQAQERSIGGTMVRGTVACLHRYSAVELRE